VVLSLLEQGKCMGIEEKFGQWARPDSMPGRTVAVGRARLTDFPKLFQYFTTLNLQNMKTITPLIQKIPNLAKS
jgi:hypothetical protein